MQVAKLAYRFCKLLQEVIFGSRRMTHTLLRQGYWL